MPKRSNQFQKAVAYIAEKLAPLGATVQESVELAEKGINGVLREVDTLIEFGAGLTRVRIAVESRDRGRKDDIQWVDGLIGKYSLLPIDRVVAVSSAGFSEAAKSKAQLNNIELLSPKEVATTDWPGKFQDIGIASLVSRLDLIHVQFETTPPLAGPVSLDDRVIRAHGSGGTVKEFIEEVRPSALERARKYITENFLTIFKTLDYLQKSAVVDHSVGVTDLSLVVGTSQYRINKVSFRVVALNERTISSVEHRVLGEDALLSSGRVGDVDILIAQTAKAPQGKVFLERRKTRKSRTKKRKRRKP